jgi:hypothetical protein
MKRTISTLGVALACSLSAYAQTTTTRVSAEASQTTAVQKQSDKSINLESGTRVAGELQNTLDVRKTKVGDQVILKTTQAIKSGGRTIVGKGARLVGHVTEVVQKTNSSGESRVGILIDRLEQGALAVPITATISSITSAAASARSNGDDIVSDNASAGGSASSMSSARASSNGGLLGGVGNVVNSTTSTVGGVVGGTTSAVGSTVDSTTAGVGRSLRGIQISESSSTSVEGGSVLSLQGSNLRLEKGTNFNLVLTQSASAGTGRNP